jgi:stage III sporulation protein AG
VPEQNTWLGRLGASLGLKPQHAGLIKIVAAGLFIGILFLSAPTLFGVGESNSPGRPPSATEVAAPADVTAREELTRLEQEMSTTLERSLSVIDGAGKVHVAITLSAGPRIDPLTNERTERTTTTEKAQDNSQRTQETTTRDTTNVMTKDGSRDVPAAAARIAAKIAGVLIVADGARDATVRARLHQAAVTELSIPAHRVVVEASNRR